MAAASAPATVGRGMRPYIQPPKDARRDHAARGSSDAVMMLIMMVLGVCVAGLIVTTISSPHQAWVCPVCHTVFDSRPK